MENGAWNYSISVDDVNEGVAIFRYGDGGARLEYANRALCELLHFELETLRGASYAEILTSVDERDVARLTAMIAALPETKTGSCTYRFADYETHETHWLTARGKYLQDERGTVAYFAYSDITLLQETIERERRLTSCLQLITMGENFAENLQKVMRLVREQYRADRSYIFEFDWAAGRMHNRVEDAAPGVSPEIDELQDMPIELINYWLPKFEVGEPVFIDDLETLRGDEARAGEYEVLAMQDIHSLMVVPIAKNGQLFCYMGVDNPAFNKPDKEFLNNVAFILAQEYLNRLQQSQLRVLSLMDPLTRLNNRHAFNQKVEAIQGVTSVGIGTVFTDVNGLKYVNDTFGHVEGDQLIQRAAEVLKAYFAAENIYRISSDEFVVIEESIDEGQFAAKVEQLRKAVVTQYGTIFSIGKMWRPAASDVLEMIREAEELMYADKKMFYRAHPARRRGMAEEEDAEVGTSPEME